MTARSIARCEANEAEPSPGRPWCSTRSAMSAMRSASAARPLRMWIQAAVIANGGRRSIAA
jgi:hypothetical protein